jgi:hypothetical protein
MANNDKQVTGWAGWVFFAGFMMLITGFLQMVAGLTALLDHKYYVVTNKALLVFNFNTWGWIDLIVGLFVLLAGMAVVGGHAWGRIVGVFLAILTIIANFAFIAAYPLWSIIVIIVSALIIYALTVHGNETAA